MPNIEFKDLNQSIGTELFTDTESFLEDLTEDATNILGGLSTGIATPVSTTTVMRREDFVTTTVYKPHPGDNPVSGYTGFHTTTLYKPHQPPQHPQPPHRHPIYRRFVTNDA